MRHAAAIAVAIYATGSVAAAEPRPAFADLPLVRATTDAPLPPDAIAASERVAGVAVKSGRHFDGDLDALSDSAVPAQVAEEEVAEEEAPARWLTAVADRACLSPLGANEATQHQIIAADAGVHGFTRSRVVGSSLELDTVWIDSRSRGARAAGGARIPLRPVAGAPGGLRLYAYRTARTLELVAVAPRGAHLSAFGRDENRFSRCGMLRLSMPSSRNAAAADVGAELPLPATADDKRNAERGIPTVPRAKLWSAHVSISRTRSDRAPVLTFVVRAEAPLGMAIPVPALR